MTELTKRYYKILSRKVTEVKIKDKKSQNLYNNRLKTIQNFCKQFKLNDSSFLKESFITKFSTIRKNK